MKNAVTVVPPAPPPTIDVQLVGTFTNLDEASGAGGQAGQTRFPRHGDAAP